MTRTILFVNASWTAACLYALLALLSQSLAFSVQQQWWDEKTYSSQKLCRKMEITLLLGWEYWNWNYYLWERHHLFCVSLYKYSTCQACKGDSYMICSRAVDQTSAASALEHRTCSLAITLSCLGKASLGCWLCKVGLTSVFSSSCRTRILPASPFFLVFHVK